jgi:TnpA family transposase
VGAVSVITSAPPQAVNSKAAMISREAIANNLFDMVFSSSSLETETEQNRRILMSIPLESKEKQGTYLSQPHLLSVSKKPFGCSYNLL